MSVNPARSKEQVSRTHPHGIQALYTTWPPGSFSGEAAALLLPRPSHLQFLDTKEIIIAQKGACEMYEQIAVSDIDVDEQWNSRNPRDLDSPSSETDEESAGFEGLVSSLRTNGQR